MYIALSFCSISEAGISLFWSLFGLLDLQDLNNCTSLEQTFGKVLVAVWLVLAVIILLNMLIALVTNKFQEVQVGICPIDTGRISCFGV